MFEKIRDRYDCLEWGMLAILASVAVAGCNAQQTDSLQRTGGQMFKKEVIFSEVNGELMRNGSPIVGAIVRRIYSHDRIDDDQIDETITDSEGRFHFPEVSFGKKLRGLFSEFSSSQLLEMDDDDGPITFWSGIKYNPRRFAEYNFVPAKLVCELGNETKKYQFDSGQVRITTRCSIESSNKD